jgi:hypothetical protein
VNNSNGFQKLYGKEQALMTEAIRTQKLKEINLSNRKINLMASVQNAGSFIAIFSCWPQTYFFIDKMNYSPMLN